VWDETETHVSALLGVLIGVVSSAVVAFFVEWQRQPRLAISIAPSADNDFRNQGFPAGLMRGLRVLVTNKPLPRVLRFMKRDAARTCRATLRFLHLDGTDYIANGMTGRWVASVEPVAPQLRLDSGQVGTLIDIARLNVASEIDIPAGESEQLDVANRCDAEVDAFGWNNESYQHNWRTPRWRLPPGRYLVEVTVRSEGQKSIAMFLLDNDHTREQMRLEGESSVRLARRGAIP
jgi:hypothetical protein